MILFALIAVGGIVASVLSFFGGFVWWFDLLASFRAQLAAGLTVVGLILVIGRWVRTATVTLAAALLNIALIVPLYLGVPHEGPADVRVLSFNLLAENDDYAEVIAYIQQVEADVVFLHEVSRPWEEALADADLPYEMTVSREEDVIFATLVLAPEGAVVTSYGWTLADPRSVAVEFEVDGIPVHILGVHALAPSDEERAVLRRQELEFVGEWAADQTGPAAVTGDFNATPWSYPFRQLIEGGLIDSEKGFGLQPSFPADPVWARVPIDHLLHNQGFEVSDRQLDPPLGSDHLPLVVDLVVVGDAP